MSLHSLRPLNHRKQSIAPPNPGSQPPRISVTPAFFMPSTTAKEASIARMLLNTESSSTYSMRGFVFLLREPELTCLQSNLEHKPDREDVAESIQSKFCYKFIHKVTINLK